MSAFTSNLRKRRRINYYELEVPYSDDYIFCTQCADFVYEYCSVHGPLLVLPDNKIHDNNLEPTHVIDAADSERSNWMRYVNCSRHWEEQNLVAFQFRGQIYYRTIKIIPKFTELMVFYGPEFAKSLNINLIKYNLPSGYPQKLDPPVTNTSKLDNNTKGLEQINIVKEFRNSVPTFHADNAIGINSSLDTRSDTVEDLKIEKHKQLNENDSLNTMYNEENSNKDEKNKNFVDDKSLICNDCGKSFLEKGYLIQHKKNHFEMKQKIYFKCTECEYQTIFSDCLTRHMRFHDIKRLISCNICKYRFSNQKCLQAHLINRHSIKLVNPKETSVSGSKYGSKTTANLDSQMYLKVNSGEKPFLCNVCNAKFSDSSTLKRHLRIHSGEKPFLCNICNAKFNQSSSLKTHLRIHSGEKPFLCNICNAKFNRLSNLKTHLRIHSGEKPFLCNICNAKFNRLSSLKTHLRIHSGEKPFLCNICNAKFNQSSSLKTHLRIHSGEKPFLCNICNAKFNQSSSLKTHLRIHSGEKPFLCNICNAKFTYSSVLKNHLRKHNGR